MLLAPLPLPLAGCAVDDLDKLSGLNGVVEVVVPSAMLIRTESKLLSWLCRLWCPPIPNFLRKMDDCRDDDDDDGGGVDEVEA